MCGICFIIYVGKQNNHDELTLKNIIQYNNSFNDEIPDKNSPEKSMKNEDDKYFNIEDEKTIDQEIFNSQSFSQNNSFDFEEKLSKIFMKSLIDRISNRGPNFLNIETIYNKELNTQPSEIYIENKCPLSELTFFEMAQIISKDKLTFLISSVLGLRGIHKLIPQPIKIECFSDNSAEKNDKDKSFFTNRLMYNGEIYNIKEGIKSITEVEENKILLEGLITNLQFENDGLIFSKILKIFSEEFHTKKDFYKSNENYAELFFRIHRTIESDHALVYYDNLNKKVLINRDIFGKRSLVVIRIIKYGIFFFSSNLSLELFELVKKFPEEFSVFEVPANTVIIIDLDNLDSNLKLENQDKDLKEIIFFYFNPELKYPSELRFKNIESIDIEKTQLANDEETIEKVHFYLNEAIKKRLKNYPILADYYMKKEKDTLNQIAKLDKLLEKENKLDFDLNSNSIAVLFSGGIDSSILAYLIASNIPDELEINLDLVNISFGKGAPDRNSGLIAFYELKKIFPKKRINLVLVDKDYEEVISREKEIMSLIYPKETHMDFNISTALNLATKLEGHLLDSQIFVPYMDEFIHKIFEIETNKCDNIEPHINESPDDNVKNNEKTKNKFFNNKKSKKANEMTLENPEEAKVEEKINWSNDILSKKLSVIDYENFLIKAEDEAETKYAVYKSNAKIIFSGLGADEFFGGYARYKTSWEKGKLKSLSMEMSKDINRVWTRNFGRDDRSCSDNGIELRFPFFDLDLIEYLSLVEKMEFITDFNKSRGTGEKIVLRKICERLGYKISHNFEKRAIQFGTKLAKETNIKKYGSNRKANGKAQFK